MTDPPHDRLDLMEVLGGPQGITDSALPALAFVLTYSLGGSNLVVAAWVAVGVAAFLTAVRIARKDTLQFALAGFVGVVIAAFIANRTGRAENFFVPGLFFNAAAATAYAISIAVRRPLLGVILSGATGEGPQWRRDPHRLRQYTRASWIWVGVFSLRLAAQLPLYLAGALVALGVARALMGLPVFAVGIWLSYLVLRRSPPESVREPSSNHHRSGGAERGSAGRDLEGSG